MTDFAVSISFPTTVHWKKKLKKVGVLGVATGMFTGYFPVAPGTAGTLVGVAIVWLWQGLPVTLQILLCLAVGALGVWASEQANTIYRKADSSHIVIDEIVGFMVAMIAIPVTAYWVVWGFILFRFFDIAKFPPANLFDQRMKNGWGVMLDDVTAGIYSNMLLHLMIRASL
jgi:phosphatidylglycerophosphatase A